MYTISASTAFKFLHTSFQNDIIFANTDTLHELQTHMKGSYYEDPLHFP